MERNRKYNNFINMIRSLPRYNFPDRGKLQIQLGRQLNYSLTPPTPPLARVSPILGSNYAESSVSIINYEFE